MKLILVLGLLSIASISLAGPIENTLSTKYARTKTFTPLSYKELPLVADPATLCEFFGYKVALDFTKTADNITTGQYYLLAGTPSGSFSFTLKSTGDGGYHYPILSITCARF